MDKSVAPGDDFYAYANGGWIKATPIPADKPSYGAAAILVRPNAAADRRHHSGSGQCRARTRRADARKVGDFYASFMDEAGIESKGSGAAEAGARRHCRDCRQASPWPAPSAARSARTSIR